MADMGIATMLMGSMAAVMAMFYLVNHSDPEFRRYSWIVISATISIFVAVLMFQAVNGCVEYQFELEEASHWIKLVVGFTQLLVWFSILQAALAFITGAVTMPCFRGHAAPAHTGPEGEDPRAEKEAHERMHLNLKCWAVLLGHITGFACINAFSEVQQMFGKGSLLISFLTVPVAFLPIRGFLWMTDAARLKIAMADDGEEDEHEKLWDEETEETEDDVIGLAISFLLTQALRFLIAGALPNAEGEDEDWHSRWQCAVLIVISFVFVTVQIVRNMYWTVALRDRASCLAEIYSTNYSRVPGGR